MASLPVFSNAATTCPRHYVYVLFGRRMLSLQRFVILVHALLDLALAPGFRFARQQVMHAKLMACCSYRSVFHLPQGQTCSTESC